MTKEATTQFIAAVSNDEDMARGLIYVLTDRRHDEVPEVVATYAQIHGFAVTPEEVDALRHVRIGARRHEHAEAGASAAGCSAKG